MSSEGLVTPRGAPATLPARTPDDQWDNGSHDLDSIGRSSRGTLPNSMISDAHQDDQASDTLRLQDSGELPASYLDTPSPLRYQQPNSSSEGVHASVYHQGQPDYRVIPHHYPFPQSPNYVGPYTLPVQHMAMAHPASPPLPYHGYHRSPPQTQSYGYVGHTPEGPSPTSSPYQTSPIYSHQAAPPSTHTRQPYPAMQYASSSGHGYRHPTYSAGSPTLYPNQYSPPSYPQHYMSPPQSGQHATWWYNVPVPAGQPPPLQQQLEANHPRHPAFQRHYTYHYPTANTSSEPRLPAAPMRSGLASPSATKPSPSYFLQEASALSSSSTLAVTTPQPNIGEGEEGPSQALERTFVRRPYHPKPPVQRSDWTMWAGNVPSDATHDEVWRFFNELPSVSEATVPDAQAVVSAFLISRSNCAFINYDSEAHLNEAIEYFNGKLLRPSDSRYSKLVCRVRKKGEELKAGVGAQRGTGMHIKWVKEQKLKEPGRPSPELGDEGSPESPLLRVLSSLSLSSGDEEHRRRTYPKHSSSSGSHSSTTSSFFARHFPRRYFILKSLTQHDLDLSVEKRLWATQQHNEGVLDQAYRTSQVFLIFGVNKSGEFYGYARMAGSIQCGEQQVAWEVRRTETPPSRGAHTPSRLPASDSPADDQPHLILSPDDCRLVHESPQAYYGSAQEELGDYPLPDGPEHPAAKHVLTAPAEIGERRKPSVERPSRPHTCEAPGKLPQSQVSEAVRLDPEAPRRAARRQDAMAEESGPEEVKGDDHEEGEMEHSWGQSFKVEWLSTERLQFYRIRHLRNPWNHDREVKVSRDGTELEPSVGEKLIEEWHTLATAAGPPPPPTAGSKTKKTSVRPHKAGS